MKESDDYIKKHKQLKNIYDIKKREKEESSKHEDFFDQNNYLKLVFLLFSLQNLKFFNSIKNIY